MKRAAKPLRRKPRELSSTGAVVLWSILALLGTLAFWSTAPASPGKPAASFTQGVEPQIFYRLEVIDFLAKEQRLWWGVSIRRVDVEGKEEMETASYGLDLGTGIVAGQRLGEAGGAFSGEAPSGMLFVITQEVNYMQRVLVDLSKAVEQERAKTVAGTEALHPSRPDPNRDNGAVN